MTTRPTHPLQSHHFALLHRIVSRLSGQAEVDEATRRAVTELTTDADPARADRLAVRPGEPAPLVERLAVWALRHATDEAVAAAAELLDPPIDTFAPPPAPDPESADRDRAAARP